MENGSALLRTAEKHLNEKYVFGARVPMDNAAWTGPWDCAEFASWCYFQVCGELFGCNQKTDPATADAYTGYWKRDALKEKCATSIAGAKSTPGAMLLRYPAPGLIGHIAISDGKGGTVEAHSTKRGVIRSTVDGRRWDIGVLPPRLAYKTPQKLNAYAPAGLVLRLKEPRMSGNLVRRLQEKLNMLGYSAGPVDGVYGPHTMAAVQVFQLSEGLAADGEAGQQTLHALGL
jgi:N-acetylmuramoyl-L-alanine amidase